jgi:hypothetical protein
MMKYKQETYSPTPQPDRHYLHTTEAAAVTPLLQSLITGIVVFVLVIVLALKWRWRDPWTWAAIAGVVAWAGMWMQLARHWFSLTRLEEWTQTDINQDGIIGDRAKHEPEEVRVRISEVKNNGHFQQHVFDLPGSPAQLRQLAEGLLDYNRPFTHREWTVGINAPFTDGQFRILRAEMIKRGLVAPASGKDARRGFVLSVVGRKIMTGFLEELPSPTSPGEVL